MIVVGTTLAAFVMDQEDTWASWLINAEEIQASYPGVQYFAALQVDARGAEPFVPLIDRLQGVGGEYWTYSLDDGRTTVTTANRLRHITVGQNLVVDYCCSAWATHLLFLAADLEPPSDVLPKLLALEHPLTGIEIPTYGLGGPTVERDRCGRAYPFPVEEHMASAAGIMIAREVFRKIRWRWDMEDGMTDDPCYHHDALTLLGVPTYVRKDCIGKHHPETIGAVETRGHNMAVHR